MSVLIKGVAMVSSESCAGCDFCGGYIMPDGIYTCICPSEISYGRNITENIVKDNKPDWCPIVEVPDSHGRLIDADALRPKTFEEEAYLFNCSALAVINNAPTVIEAEGTE